MTQKKLNIIWLAGTIALGTIAQVLAATTHYRWPIGYIVAGSVMFGSWLEKKRWYRILRENGFQI